MFQFSITTKQLTASIHTYASDVEQKTTPPYVPKRKRDFDPQKQWLIKQLLGAAQKQR
jgi:hypothetical protein